MIEDTRHHLHVTLMLHVAAHHTEAQTGLTVFGHKARDNGVERTFTRSHAIGMRRG